MDAELLREFRRGNREALSRVYRLFVGDVESLARRGLLRRRVRTGDSRFVEAHITARGEAAYRKMLPLAVAEYRSAVVGFEKAEVEWLKRATLRMLGNIGVELLEN